MAELLTINEAAAALETRPGTVRRWIREGCPVARPGRRGRGHAAKVSLPAVRAWRDAQRADEKLAVELATTLPLVLGEAAYSGWRQIEGADKRRSAGLLAAAWYLMSSGALDHLRGRFPDAEVPEISSLPEPIERLRKIARNG